MNNTPTPTNTPIWLRLCLWIGLACIGQFFVVALIGVVRGYSVQSYIPFYVMLSGTVLLSIRYCGSIILLIGHLRSSFVFREKLTKMTWWQIPGSFWIFYLAIFCQGLAIIVGIPQGRYQQQGDEFYKQKNYSAANAMYQKEVDTWYLRLLYNCWENASLFGIARSYCQLENFEQGRQAYQQLGQMPHGGYQELAQKELAKLDKELENIAEYEKQLADAADDNQKADILFDMALSYISINCHKKAKEQYALIQTLNIDESRKEQAQKFAVNYPLN